MGNEHERGRPFYPPAYGQKVHPSSAALPSANAPLAVPRLAFLDVGRCVAAMLVLLEHALDVFFPELQKATVGGATIGKVGVILFFLISGFIIPQSLASGSYRRFWIRRAFRLYPVYWLSIGLVLLYCCRSGTYENLLPDLHVADWLINLTMLQGFITGKNVLGVFWTLQYELIFYVGCWILCMAEWLKHVRYLAIGAFAMFALIEVGGIFARDQMVIKITSASLVLLAPWIGFAAQQYVDGRLSRKFLIFMIAVQFAAFVAIWIAGYEHLAGDVTVGMLGEFAITWGLAYLVFFVLLSWRHLKMPTVLRYLGRISYSIYLLHVCVIQVFANWQAAAGLRALAWFVLTIGLSAVTFHTIELPGIRLGRWFERRLFPSPRQPANAIAAAPVAVAVVLRPIR